MRTAKVIEFTGIPNSGKTTLIHRLRDELPKKGITVQVQREDAEIVPTEISKRTWDRNVWITFGQLQSIVQAYHSDCDIVLLDRGLYDALYWANFMLKQGTSTSAQSEGVLKILNIMYENLDFFPDYLFLIDVSVDEALRRRALMEGTSVYSKPDFLLQYQETFNDIFKGYIEDDDSKKVIPTPSFYYDTTLMTSDQIYDAVAEKLITICNK